MSQCYGWRLALRDLAFKAENRAVSWGQWLCSRVFEWQEAAPPRVVPGGGGGVTWQRPGLYSHVPCGLGQVTPLTLSVSPVRGSLAQGCNENTGRAGPAEAQPGGPGGPVSSSHSVSPAPQMPVTRTAPGSARSRVCRPPSRPCARPSAGTSSTSKSQTPSMRWPSGQPRPPRGRGHAPRARCCRTANAVSPHRGRQMSTQRTSPIGMGTWTRQHTLGTEASEVCQEGEPWHSPSLSPPGAGPGR